MIPHIPYHIAFFTVLFMWNACCFRYGMHVFRHGHGPWSWMERQFYEERIYTALWPAIALQSIHLFQSYCIFFGRPTHSCIYIASYVFTPGLYRMDIGVSQRWGSKYTSSDHYLSYPPRRDSPTTVTHIPLFIDLRGSSRYGE